jgi:hypothetical protein
MGWADTGVCPYNRSATASGLSWYILISAARSAGILPAFFSCVAQALVPALNQSTPGHAGRVSTPARGGHKSPNV